MVVGRPKLLLLVGARGGALLDAGGPRAGTTASANSQAAPGVATATSDSLDDVVGVHVAVEAPPAGRLAAGQESRPTAPSLGEAEVGVPQTDLPGRIGIWKEPPRKVRTAVVVAAARSQ